MYLRYKLNADAKQIGNFLQAWQLWNDGRLHELVDPILGDGFEHADVMRYAQVALLCAQEDPKDRPTMSDVVALLNFESLSLLPDPKQPSQLVKGGAAGDKLSTCVSQSSRTIDITITSSAPVSTRVRIIVEPET
jgi:interleukin-1 receptor-associated kinase 1